MRFRRGGWVWENGIWVRRPDDVLWRRDPPDVRAGAPEYDQFQFRFRDDSTALNTDGGWLASANTNISRQTGTANRFRVRIVLDETGNRDGSYSGGDLRYDIDGGGYAAISTTTPIRFTDGLPTNGATCSTQLLGSPSVGSFENDGTYHENDAGITEWVHTKNNFAEFEFCLYLVDAQVNHNENISLRLYDSASEINSYTNTPIVVVNKPGVAKAPFPRRMNQHTTVRM